MMQAFAVRQERTPSLPQLMLPKTFVNAATSPAAQKF